MSKETRDRDTEDIRVQHRREELDQIEADLDFDEIESRMYRADREATFRNQFSVGLWVHDAKMRVHHCNVTHKASGEYYRVVLTDIDIGTGGENIYNLAIADTMRELYARVTK